MTSHSYSARYAAWVCLVAVLGWGACSDDSGQNADSAPGRFGLFMTGLNGWWIFTEERREPVFEALEELDVDVLCLTDLFSDEDNIELISRLKVRFPHSHWQKTTDDDEKKVYCDDASVVIAAQKCIQDNCTPLGITISSCVVNECKDLYDKIPRECMTCLNANVDKQMDCIVGGATMFGVNGRNGLLLLSKQPMQDVTFTELDTVLVHRGILSATIGDTAVHCTQLPGIGYTLPFPDFLSPYATWEEQNRAMVQQTIDHSSGPGCNVLLGNMETGPGNANNQAIMDDNFQLFAAAGFEEPWENAPCTLCKENDLARPPSSQWVDHIMVKSCPDLGSLSYRRILDDRITVVDRMGAEQSTWLSPHFGVLLEAR